MSFMKSLRIALTAFLLLLWLPGFASGLESAESDGYLFCLQDTDRVELFSEVSGIEPVAPEIGLYKGDSLEKIHEFVSAEGIAYVEPNYTVTLFNETNNSEYAKQWNLKMLGAEAAQKQGLDGTGVRIGILDSGLYTDHEDLQGAHIVSGHNYVDNNENTGDTVGHGTFVTGVIAATSNNGIGVAGLASKAEIVPLKCFDAKNSSIAEIAAAIYDAVNIYHCDILNMSFGTTMDSQTLKNAISYAAEQGAIMVAAVGNNGSQVKKYPAAYDEVIGVGMVNANKEVAVGSQRNDSVFVTAPGYGLTGLAIGAVNAYKTGNGTSYACPHITAIAALLKQRMPDITEEMLKQLFKGNAEDLGEPGYDTSYGYGLVYIPELLKSLPVQIKFSQDELVIQGVYREIGTDVQTGLAGYDRHGKLVDCFQLSTQDIDGSLALNCSIATLKSMQYIKVFFWDSQSKVPVKESEMLCKE